MAFLMEQCAIFPYKWSRTKLIFPPFLSIVGVVATSSSSRCLQGLVMQELGHMGDQHIMLMYQVVLIPPSLANEIRSMVCVLKISFGRYYTTRPCGGIQHIQISWMWIWSSFHRSTCTDELVSWNERRLSVIWYLCHCGNFCIDTFVWLIVHPHLLVRVIREQFLSAGGHF